LPVSPDFYISTAYNTENHAPRGKASYASQNEVDSCFAKVIRGFDVVYLMLIEKHDLDSFNGLVNSKEIESIEIL